jgi:hypothetical protein
MARKIKRNAGKKVLFVYINGENKDFLSEHARIHNLSLTQLVEVVLGRYVKDNSKTKAVSANV